MIKSLSKVNFKKIIEVVIINNIPYSPALID